MHEIDKMAFGAFLAQLRREKGYTQKELAEKLFVSDKAVSKWERGLSMPDIALLMPLAEILDVTVTELLEGRRLEAEELAPDQVEEIVKKALRFTEEPVKPSLKQTWPILAAIAVSAVELILEWAFFRGVILGTTFLVFWGLSLFFGIYFWFFLARRLPGYYDEHEISYYSDGILRMNFLGVAFNNANWPRITKALRNWSLITLVTVLPIGVLVEQLPLSGRENLMLQMVCLFLYLGSLFVPVYLCAQKPGKALGKEKKKIFITLAVLLCVLPFMSHGSFRSGTRVGYFENSTGQTWSASYVYFDGRMQRSLNPKESAYCIQVTTQGGTLSMDISDGDGLVFTEENIPTGSYPITLDGKVTINVSAEGHKGSFSIAPAE